MACKIETSMKKSLYLPVILFLGICTALPAQPLNRATYNTMIQLAEEQMAKKDYYRALEWYEKAYEESRDRDLVILIADLHYMLRDYRKAARWYGRALRRDRERKYAEKRFEYARALKMNGDYDEAIGEFEAYIQEGKDPVKKALAEIEKAGAEWATLAQPVEGVTITNAGKKINSKNSEYSAYLVDGMEEMYFASFHTDDIIELEINEEEGEPATDFEAKIYRAERTDDGWGEPSPLPETINRPGFFHGNVTLSPDGRRMFFTRQKVSGNVLVESKIYVSEKSGNRWGAAHEVKGVNGDWIAKSPAVGELFGNEVLYFASDMDGGFGGLDIYYATYEGNGEYADPVNLGPTINTIGDEDTPFYRDGMLYFSSTGHPGMGGYDIFQSPWDGSQWGEPQNMGKGYNSPADDLFFMIDKEGYHGFLVSNRAAEGARSVHSRTCCNDIYNVSLKKIEANLLAMTFDAETKEPLSGATVQLIELLEEGGGKTESQTNDKGNAFNFPLALDRAYRVIATAENYEPDTLEFNTVGLLDSKTFEHMLNLKPLPKFITITREEPFELENIYYDFDDDKILPDAEKDLQVLYELMTQYPDMVIELSSHTDARGTDAYNRDLSQRRAESARRWLLNKGIARRRIIARGYGETVPKTVTAKLAARYPFLKEGDVLTEEYIEQLATEEQKEIAHQINRRTEFKILEGPTSIKVEEKRLIQIGNRQVEENVKPPKNDKQSLPQTLPPNHDTLKIHPYSSLYGRKDLRGVPIMHFDERVVDFGTVKRGEKRNHTFRFTNRGDTELVIDFIQACECTVTDYSKKRVAPGESGEIFVTFDSSEKETGETIDVEIFLQNLEPDTEVPIIERLQYVFEIEQ